MKVFARGLVTYAGGKQEVRGFFSEEDVSFLKGIGHTAQEVFDFVEDCFHSDGVSPSRETALLVAQVRKQYFERVQGRVMSEKEGDPNVLPGKQEEYQGLRWLPRIVMKAQWKLRGELDPNMMYGCGGDRNFLGGVDWHPADFLMLVWREEEALGEGGSFEALVKRVHSSLRLAK